MNQRENFFAMLRGDKPEFVPCMGMFNTACLIPYDPESQFMLGGTDGFGVNWVVTKEGAMPEPGKILFEEMADWKSAVKFPDIDAVDYKAIAAQELAGVNRGELVVYLLNGAIGMFTRMVAMMGFENALIALFEDPESCNEFGEAFADYEIKRVNKIIDAYQPDVMWFADDLAHARGLFMSTDTYYSVIRPHNKRIIEQITSRGVIVDFHCCGKCDAIVPDFVEMGCRIWNPAQVMNDLEGIQKKYGSRLIIEGGWNSQGRPSCVDATEQEICDEVERTIITYGGYGNYIMLPFIFNEQGNALFLEDSRKQGMFATYQRLCRLS